jgi:hypothetical protein
LSEIHKITVQELLFFLPGLLYEALHILNFSLISLRVDVKIFVSVSVVLAWVPLTLLVVVPLRLIKMLTDNIPPYPSLLILSQDFKKYQTLQGNLSWSLKLFIIGKHVGICLRKYLQQLQVPERGRQMCESPLLLPTPLVEVKPLKLC